MERKNARYYYGYLRTHVYSIISKAKIITIDTEKNKKKPRQNIIIQITLRSYFYPDYN